MSTSAANRKARRKALVVRVVAISLAALMLISVLIATLMGGYY